MNLLNEILRHNREFLDNSTQEHGDEIPTVSKVPTREIAILTCMDTRLVNFMEQALGIERGHAKVIKSAGNSISGMFDSVVRSLLVCIYELGVSEIFVIGHYECGMAKTTSESLTKAMLSRGVAPEAIQMVRHELEHWADGFSHPVDNVQETVSMLRMNPLSPKDVAVHGLMMHPNSGEVEVVEVGYEL